MANEHLAQILRILAVTADYYGKPVQPSTLATIARDLQAHSIADIERAVDLHRRDPTRGRFFPLTADLQGYLVADEDAIARAAWDCAIAAAARYGKYTGIAFDDRRITACIAGMGGWVRFCAITHDEMPFRQRDFVERYASMARTNSTDHAPESLPGMNTDGAVAFVGNRPQAPEALPEPVNVENITRLANLARSVASGGIT